MAEWNKIDAQYEALAKVLGTSWLAIEILEDIHYHGVKTQKEICQKRNLPKQVVNLVVKDWLESGYITLTETKSDRRNKEIAFTEKGEQYRDGILATIQQIEEEVWCNTEEAELDFMLKYLKRWSEELAKSVNVLQK